MIHIQNINFSYSKHQVFENLSLDFKEGQIYGLLGLNGAGKSTLLYLMSGLLFPQGGSVEFNGYDMTKRSPKALADMFLVPEEFELPENDIQFLMGLGIPEEKLRKQNIKDLKKDRWNKKNDSKK